MLIVEGAGGATKPKVVRVLNSKIRELEEEKEVPP